MRTKPAALYLHTLNNQPAHFNGKQIVYGRKTITAAPLRQIRAEQKASAAWRRAQGFPEWSESGYVTVKIG